MMDIPIEALKVIRPIVDQNANLIKVNDNQTIKNKVINKKDLLKEWMLTK